MDTPLDEILVGERARKTVGDLGDLQVSIEAIGLLHPIVIDEDRRLIAGERRLEACKALGWETIAVHAVRLKDILRGQCDENVVRMAFRPSEQDAIAEELEERERLAAKERQREHGNTAPGKAKNTSAKFAPVLLGKSRAKVAQAVGLSHPSLKKIREVCKAAETEPEKYQSLVDEMDKTGRVNGVHKKLKTAQQAEKLRAEPATPPDGKYRVLVIDPPWSYGRSADPTHRTANPYPAMSLESIHSLPIGEWAQSDSVLWLWTTNAFMRESFTCIDAWGFQQKTILTWVKPRIGTGDWLRGKTEHCLLAIKGRPTLELRNQSTALVAPMGKHSEKPDEFYQMIEGLCPGSKLDVFARKSRNGWTAYGDEIG